MSSKTHRIPSGDADGAIGGMYPNAVSVGCPPMSGWSQWDDFGRAGTSGDFGDSRLSSHTLGSGITMTGQAPTANTEVGILRVTTDAGSTTLEGGSLGMPSSPGVYASSLPGGLTYRAKLRLVNTANLVAWSGFIEDHSYPFDGGVDSFVGFWGAAGGNWFGVVYNGTVWQAVDMGVAADTTWRTLALEIPAKPMATTDTPYGIRFGTYNADVPPGQGPELTRVAGFLSMDGLSGTPFTLVAAGIVTTDLTTPQRSMEIDYYGVGGPGRR